nr:hypothetical protein [Tanacetum cinerariifolium]
MIRFVRNLMCLKGVSIHQIIKRRSSKGVGAYSLQDSIYKELQELNKHSEQKEVDEETKTITFLLSWWDKPLSFTQDEFISAIGLPICKDAIPLPPKETVRAGLSTLSSFNKDKPTLSSNVLVNSFPLNMNVALHGWYYMVSVTIVGEEYDKVFNYLDMLNAPFEEKVFTCAKQVKPYSLIPPSMEMNADDTVDKSLSKAFVQPLTQSKAPTDLKTKKKRIPPSFKPKSPYKVRVIPPKKQVTETQDVDVTVATANATKNLVASELAEEQGNQPSAAEAKKLMVLDQNVEEEVKDIGFVVMKEVTFKQIMDEVDSKTQGAQENAESFFDIELEIKIIKSYQAATISGTAETFYAFADKPTQSGPLGHLQEELNLLNNKVDQLESSISKKVVEDIQSSIPTIFVDTLKLKLSGLLSKALNNILPKLLMDSIKTSVSESIAENQRFFLLQKALRKSFHTKMRKSIKLKDKNNPAKEKDAQHHDQTKGEQISGANIADIVQREQPSAQEDLLKPEEQQKSLHEFTNQLFRTTSSKFSPTPPREPTPLRDPTKGKEVAIMKEQVNELVTYQEE